MSGSLWTLLWRFGSAERVGEAARQWCLRCRPGNDRNTETTSGRMTSTQSWSVAGPCGGPRAQLVVLARHADRLCGDLCPCQSISLTTLFPQIPFLACVRARSAGSGTCMGFENQKRQWPLLSEGLFGVTYGDRRQSSFSLSPAKRASRSRATRATSSPGPASSYQAADTGAAAKSFPQVSRRCPYSPHRSPRQSLEFLIWPVGDSYLQLSCLVMSHPPAPPTHSRKIVSILRGRHFPSPAGCGLRASCGLARGQGQAKVLPSAAFGDPAGNHRDGGATRTCFPCVRASI